MTLGKGQHIVPQLWESARCADISLKRAYKETLVMALLKTIGRTGQKSPQATSASQAPGPAQWPVLGAAGAPPQLGAGSVRAHREHAPPSGRGWKPTPLPKAQRARAGRAGQRASGGGGLQSHHAGMLGPGSLSEPAIWPCILGPRLGAKQGPGARSTALQAPASSHLSKAFLARGCPWRSRLGLGPGRRLGAPGKSASHPEIKSPPLVVLLLRAR